MSGLPLHWYWHWQALLRLDDDALRERLDISKAMHRKKILKNIKRLHAARF